MIYWVLMKYMCYFGPRYLCCVINDYTQRLPPDALEVLLWEFNSLEDAGDRLKSEHGSSMIEEFIKPPGLSSCCRLPSRIVP